MVSTVLALLAGGTGQMLAADFYVGGDGASDRNPGTASQPFATIQKAADVAAAGDCVNIRPGIYRETVVPANSGPPGQPITFQPDGDAQVTVSGADLVDGDWTVYSGQIYQTAIALPLTGYGEQITGNETLLANQVFVDGKMMMEARWPNLADSDDLLNRADFRPIAKDAWTAGPGGTTHTPGCRNPGDSWRLGRRHHLVHRLVHSPDRHDLQLIGRADRVSFQGLGEVSRLVLPDGKAGRAGCREGVVLRRDQAVSLGTGRRPAGECGGQAAELCL